MSGGDAWRFHGRSAWLLVFAVWLLKGCTGVSVSPIFGSSPYDVETAQEWTPANILIGDAQVFTRATLLNDRRREQRFLETLIEESRNQTFEPELQRDLRSVAIALSQLGFSFDPAARANYRRVDDLADLKHEVNKLRLQAELARLDAQIERIKTLDAAEVPKPPDEIEVAENALQTPSGSPSEEVEGLLNQMSNRLAAVLGDIEGGTDGRVGSTDAASAPEDYFRDLDAYRTMLRAHEAANALDDTHDLRGNTVYRIQIRATVIPEVGSDTFGVVEVFPRKSGSTVSDDATAQLYSSWLDHVTRQLNQRRADYLATFNLLPDDKKLFGIVTFKLARRSGGNSVIEPIRVAVPPVAEGIFQEAVDGLGLPRGPARKRRQLMDGVRYLAEETGHKRVDEVPCRLLPIVGGLEMDNVKRLFPKYDELARSYIQYYPAFALMLNRLVDLGHSGGTDVDSEQVEELSKLYRQAYDAAREYVRDRIAALDGVEEQRGSGQSGIPSSVIKADLAHCKKYLKPKAPGDWHLLPRAFKDTLTCDTANTIRVLDVTPAERAQRVSTLASAVASIQTAASVAAGLPAVGVGFKQASAKLNSEAGKLEAVQRVPLVVGYLEADPEDASGGAPRFGWILGPAFVPDPAGKRLERSQLLKPYDLQVDLSVPAWWRSLELSVLTAWAGPLGEAVDCDDCRRITLPVDLPRSDSDMDALTRFLFRRLSVDHLGASDRPRILEVSPTVIEPQARNTTLTVRGPGLWRGQDVFIYGVRQTDVSVLPDMSGLAVGVAPSSLPMHVRDGEVDPLAVFTPAGKAVYPYLKLFDPRDSTQQGMPIVSVLPYHINGERLEIRPVSRRFPPGTSPRIAFRPSGGGQEYDPIEVVASITASRTMATASVSWTGGVNMHSGDSLEVRFVYRLGDEMMSIRSAPTFLVYYESSEHAAVTFDDVDARAGSRGVVQIPLTLPFRAPEAYPLLFDPETEIEANGGTATLERDQGRVVVNVSPPAGGFVAGDVEFNFANRNAGDGELPAIEGVLTIR